ncbi:hypothetical protein Tco_0796870 [Tanacetum coccineum]
MESLKRNRTLIEAARTMLADSKVPTLLAETIKFNTLKLNAASINKVNAIGGKTSIELLVDPNMPALEDYNIFDFTRDDKDDGVVADMNNLDTTIKSVSMLTTEFIKISPSDHKSTAKTPITQKPLLKDEDGKEVDVHMYRSMIGSLMYLTSSRPSTSCRLLVQYQVNPKHNTTVIKLEQLIEVLQQRLSIPGLDLISCSARTDSGSNSTTKKSKESVKLMMEKLFGIELELILVKVTTVEDEAVHKELGDSLVRAATTASSLEAEQDSGNITKTRSKATPNESSSLGTTSGGGPRGNTLQSDEDRFKLKELMELCTNLQNRVLDLEKTKTTQANEIASLKRRVKKLEKKNRSRTHKLKRLYKVGLTARVESFRDEESLVEDASKQGRINAIDDITLVSVQDDADKEMFDVDALNGEEVFVTGQNENVVKEIVDVAQVSTAATTVTITTEEMTLAQAVEALKTSKPKDKGKGIMIEEPVKPMKKKELIRLDEEVALQLQAEFDEEERLIDADHQLAKRLQAQEQEELSVEEKATLFQQLLEKRERFAN